MKPASLGDLSRTKLYMPTPRSDSVVRPRLTASLEEGINNYPLTLICAPAGYGKTTSLCHALTQQQLPTAWLSLDKQDNDPVRFWTYVIAALQTIRAEWGRTTLSALQSPQPLPLMAVLPTLLDQISRRRAPLILVLDDYQFIHDRTIHETLTYLLDNLPSSIHLIISTRVDPPFSLARMRVRNQLLELRAADLRFNSEESGIFLNRTVGLGLSAEEVIALETRTEGWIAGLQLAALSMRGQRDLAGFVKAFAGSHVYVAEYLVGEVLQHQPEEIQQFLMKTAILNRLNGKLCEAVTGRINGQAVLTALDHANLFLIPLDNRAEWFRYHHLFAELLRVRLHQTFSADERAVLHRRAAEWYIQHGYVSEAVDHALQGKDDEQVAALVEQNARAMMFAGSVNLLNTWLTAIPKPVIQAHPRLTIYKIWIDVIQGKADLSEQAIQNTDVMLKALVATPENEQLRVEWMVISSRFIALNGNTSRAIQFAQEALEKLPESDLASRARIHSALTIAYGLEGEVDKAQFSYHQCLNLAMTTGYYSLAAHTTMMMAAGLDQHYGRLREASKLYQSIIDMGDHAGQRVFFPAGQGYIGLAEIYLKQNDLQAAEKALQQGIALCSQAGLAGLSTGYTIESRLRQARGDFEGALETLNLVEQTAPKGDFSGMIRQIQIRLAVGDVEGASRWASPLMALFSTDSVTAGVPLLVLEFIESILIRVLLAQGEIDKALRLLDRLQSTAEPAKRWGRLMDAYLLRALTLHKQNDGHITRAALDNLVLALTLAEPEGYRLLFLEACPAAIPLLDAVVKDPDGVNSVQKYAQDLLNVIPGHELTIPSHSSANGSPKETLTMRELEVLKLIAAGDSNQTIAHKLVITLSAVKKHTGNIFGKLNVRSRTQAIARARQLGLLPTDS